MAAPAEFALDMGAPPPDPVAEEAVRKAYDAGLLKRIQIFLEATVKMVSTVFLAACVSLAKMDMRDRPLVVILLSVVACLTLVVAIVSLVLITWPNRFPDKLYGWCMLLIHGCGVLLMVVAYLALRLISEDGHDRKWGIVAAILILFTLGWFIYALCKRHAHGAFEDSVDQEKHLGKLENWVDFLAATTFLSFFGLGALLIGGQYTTLQLGTDCLANKDKEIQPMLLLYGTFCICIAGVPVMLACMAPPLPKGTCYIFHTFNYIFGFALGAIVLLMTLETIGGCWCVPSFLRHHYPCWCVPGLAFMLSVLPFLLLLVLWRHYCAIGRGDQEVTPTYPVIRFCKRCLVILCCAIGSRGDNEVKPASLDLIKATCTGFLTISAYTISQNTPVSIGNSYSWFIFFTAIAVNNFICWRLFTHHKKPSAAMFTAANTAFLCAHIYVIAAVFPFGFMTYHAFNKNTSTAPSCHAPSPAPS